MLDKNSSPFAVNLEGKSIVADTSALLTAGVGLLSSLPSCTFIIPSIVVKELEDKRSHTTLGFMAREWLRLLEELRRKHGEDMNRGVDIPSHPHITLKVEPNHVTQASLPTHLQDGSNDSTILSVAYNLQKAQANEQYVVLSNDLPMRLKATLDLHMEAVEYAATEAAGVEPYDGRLQVQLEDSEYVETIVPQGVPLEKLVQQKLAQQDTSWRALVSVQVPGNTKPVEQYLKEGDILRPVTYRQEASHVVSRSLEQSVAYSYLLQDPATLPLVSIGGGAGSGKTLLSVSAGLQELSQDRYQRVIVLRSLHEMGQGQEMGFLPGDVGEKMEAWAGAVYDALDVIALSSMKGAKLGPSRERSEAMKAEVRKLRERIEVSPITYLRGRSLSNSFIILDEAQNFSRNELLNILSRAGENTKMVLCWDPAQVDNRFLQAGNKADVWSVVERLKREPLFAHLTLLNTERSQVAELASSILNEG